MKEKKKKKNNKKRKKPTSCFLAKETTGALTLYYSKWPTSQGSLSPLQPAVSAELVIYESVGFC